MKSPYRSIRIVAIASLAIALVAKLDGTSEYDCKPGEFLVVKDGKSPDKKFVIVSGEKKKDEFGVYLVDAATKKIIGKLEEVATDLDTAPDAYYAHWSPDSKHVGISSRSDRHMFESLQQLIPEITEADLVPGQSGVRAQALMPNGKLVDDFLIVNGRNSIHVCNAPSPAATASLEIGRFIASRLP